MNTCSAPTNVTHTYLPKRDGVYSASLHSGWGDSSHMLQCRRWWDMQFAIYEPMAFVPLFLSSLQNCSFKPLANGSLKGSRDYCVWLPLPKKTRERNIFTQCLPGLLFLNASVIYGNNEWATPWLNRKLPFPKFIDVLLVLFSRKITMLSCLIRTVVCHW